MSEKQSDKKSDKSNQYWKANIRLMIVLLSIWFFVSFGCGILFSEYLDQFHFFGFKLGYWFAHQGAIFVFVILIFVYSWQMNRIDKKYGEL